MLFGKAVSPQASLGILFRVAGKADFQAASEP